MELPDGERAAFLAAECHDEPTLLEQTRRLLQAHARLGSFLDAPAVWHGGDPDPLRVGRFEVTRMLGEGGMGRVYLAEPGPVAIKLIRRDVDPDSVQRRFMRERQLLMRLSHPNIAHLLEGGVTDDGTPYLVLDYVEGVQLDDYWTQHTPPLRERLALFGAICEAVAFAHRQLVIHRDLKPANVLVKPSGTPVVLDFGLAKLFDVRLGHALDSTATGHRLLTPDYASPEQVRGDRITPATDVYALGILLYELLTGIRPHRFTTWSLADIVQVICERESQPPSEALRRLEGDAARWPIEAEDVDGRLDEIVMKAMATSPAKRYTHVEHLGADVRRHLNMLA